MSATATVIETLTAITEAVEKIKNDELQHFPDAASVGDCVRQGDIYIQMIEAVTETPALYTKLDEPQLQLADGDTKGSRHCLASADGVTMYKPVRTDFAVARYIANLRGMPAENDSQLRSVYFDAATRDEARELDNALQLAGPIFRLDKPNVVTHPEHGDWALNPGSYRIVYQRTINQQQVIQRVLD